MIRIFTAPGGLTHDELEEGRSFAPRFDAAGLVTVVTVEAETKDVHMVAPANAEALSLTLDTGIAHYCHARAGRSGRRATRPGNCRKSSRSGSTVDQDCVIFSVRHTGRGAACHTGRKKLLLPARRCRRRWCGARGYREARLFDPAAVYRT